MNPEKWDEAEVRRAQKFCEIMDAIRQALGPAADAVDLEQEAEASTLGRGPGTGAYPA